MYYLKTSPEATDAFLIHLSENSIKNYIERYYLLFDNLFLKQVK